MNETLIKSYVAAGLVLLLMAGSFYVAWVWQANSYGEQLAAQSAGYQAHLTAINNAGAAQTSKALAIQQAAEQKAADIDAQRTKEKTDALAENETLRQKYAATQAANDRLRADVAAGTQRLRIAGSCSANGSGSSGVPGTASAAGVGNAGTVELSGEAGQAVFDLRADLIRERSALKALQDYARVCHGG
ncbi:lysis system i-spanin subunit Rz [Pseudomonas eucalypticola]|uniref:lysis system i-spanin subunit Rz n=1 Tax=Pseudomonas eucalypticola TaxID=2599595 RepID=UPI001AD8DE20|nr:lysis system i-spanin subunit Rz [Pseudomonas eucalypticola]